MKNVEDGFSPCTKCLQERPLLPSPSKRFRIPYNGLSHRLPCSYFQRDPSCRTSFGYQIGCHLHPKHGHSAVEGVERWSRNRHLSAGGVSGRWLALLPLHFSSETFHILPPSLHPSTLSPFSTLQQGGKVWRKEREGEGIRFHQYTHACCVFF